MSLAHFWCLHLASEIIGWDATPRMTRFSDATTDMVDQLSWQLWNWLAFNTETTEAWQQRLCRQDTKPHRQSCCHSHELDHESLAVENLLPQNRCTAITCHIPEACWMLPPSLTHTKSLFKQCVALARLTTRRQMMTWNAYWCCQQLVGKWAMRETPSVFRPVRTVICALVNYWSPLTVKRFCCLSKTLRLNLGCDNDALKLCTVQY